MNTTADALIDEIISRMITEAKIPYARDVSIEVMTAEGPVVIHGLVFSQSAKLVESVTLATGKLEPISTASQAEVFTPYSRMSPVNRTHEECDGCARLKEWPPTCAGHEPGPVTCDQFSSEAEQQDATDQVKAT